MERLDSECGSFVPRRAASNTRDPQFESHRIIHHFQAQFDCIEKTEWESLL